MQHDRLDTTFRQHAVAALHALIVTPREKDLRVVLGKRVRVVEVGKRDPLPDSRVLLPENAALNRQAQVQNQLQEM